MLQIEFMVVALSLLDGLLRNFEHVFILRFLIDQYESSAMCRLEALTGDNKNEPTRTVDQT